MKNGTPKCKEDLNTERAKEGSYITSLASAVLRLARWCMCARTRLRVLLRVLETWSKFAHGSIIINCYSDNCCSDSNLSTLVLVYWKLDSQKIKQQKEVLSKLGMGIAYLFPRYAITHKQTCDQPKILSENNKIWFN